MANILNVSEQGNVISEATAKIILFGKYDSIKNHYLNARRNCNNELAGCDDFDHIELNGESFPLAEAGHFYELMWYQFFKQNPTVKEQIKRYDDFLDDEVEGNGDNVMNSCARVCRLVKNYGLTGLKSHCKVFANELSQRTRHKLTKTPFEEMDLQARMLVKEYYGMKSKEEVFQMLTDSLLIRLFDIRYDEYDKNCSEEFVMTTLKKLRREYETKQDTLEDSSEIILE